ncbi:MULTISPECIES: DUF2946 family protein [Sphingomonas]|uniref:DUF2946 family protein n=1 Tax=Sphingomonas TaxID=13687 RepID=UPI0008343FAA|nr:DUF2946 family protein [Sphingomonas sp. CCH10-B3]
MTNWRALIRNHPRLALLLVALALSMRALLPQGYMVTPSNGTIMVSICSGQAAQMVAIDVDKHDGDHQDGATADHPCAFSGLGMSAMGGADIVLLAIAFAYVLTLGFLAITAPPRPAVARLRPPLRAPPVLG